MRNHLLPFPATLLLPGDLSWYPIAFLFITLKVSTSNDVEPRQKQKKNKKIKQTIRQHIKLISLYDCSLVFG